MDRSITFCITDVFASEKYSGNQLLTFLPGPAITDQEMLSIAREINFSETTFILSEKSGQKGFTVRIFTPGEEVPFAGHPTLGTAFVIRQELIKHPVDMIKLDLKIGSVPVTFPKEPQNKLLWMEQATPEFGKKVVPEQVASVLGLATSEIDSEFPVEEVSTGFPFLIVPLKSLDTLKKCTLNRERYYYLVNDIWAKNILVFCPNGYNSEQQLGVRVFPLFYGIEEDAATGSGNGCLAAYLVKNRYFKSNDIDITVGQGYELGRPSQLYLRANELSGKFKVQVGGKVISIAKGTWYL